MNEITRNLENQKIVPLLLSYAVPAVIGTMVNALYNIVDRIFIGQAVGALAISGLTLTFPILMFLQAFGMLIGAGASTRISIFLGRKENGRAENVLGNALTLTFILSVLTIIPSLIFMEKLLLVFGGSEQTIPYAKDYLYIAIPGNLLSALSFGFNAAMRASGYPRKAMAIMVLGALLNVALDALFIYVFDWGIEGAAWATVIAMAVASVFVLEHFFREESIIRFHKKYYKPDFRIMMSIFTIGMSPFAMQLAGSLVNVVMNQSLKEHGGDLAIGANGIISSVGLLLVLLIMGITQGMQPVVGFNYGAGNHERVLHTFRLVLVAATVITSLGCLCSVLFPEWIVRAFTNDAELIAISSNGLRITLSAFVIVGSQIVISQFFQSIGFAWKAMFLSLSRQCLFLIPAILFLPQFFDLDGVWLASPFSDLLAAISAWIFFWHHMKYNNKRQ
ncbi:MAG: MATE family efflux transporter [Massilibacteroides sp.]|nr:MATE family efflux transporter [Massilibacteroides sp.]